MSGSKAFRLLVLRACRDLPPEADGFVIDRVIAEQTGVSLAEVRDCLVLLEESSEIAMVRTVDGTIKAFLEAKGRLTLHQAFPFDRATGPERVITVKQVADMILRRPVPGIRHTNIDFTLFFCIITDHIRSGSMAHPLQRVSDLAGPAEAEVGGRQAAGTSQPEGGRF